MLLHSYAVFLSLRLKLNNALYYTVEIALVYASIIICSRSIDICYFSAYASTDINLYLLNKDKTLNSGNLVSALYFYFFTYYPSI